MKPLYRTGHFLSTLVGRLVFGFRVVGRDRIIEDGAAILAMNHQSYLDPPMAGIACRRDIHFLARKSLLDWPVLGRVFPRLNVVPVDQERADSSALKAVIRLLREGKRVLVFPEGARSPDGSLQPARPGVGFIVAKSMAPVVPMRIFGAYEAFPRNAKFPKPGRITVVVGKPMRFSSGEIRSIGREGYRETSGRIMQAIASLELPNP